ncbi:MAG TPA: AraC family transcriptional regulator, partial [Clostridia bacterium]|nr:AraC family transcriptional regulator [Clostridia bacterium]
MPTARILFAAPGLELGTYRCLPGDRAWREENSVGEGYHVVIPGPPVLIEQSRARPVVANANHAIFYNDHEVYRRGLLSDRGDACVFIRAEDHVLRAVAAEADPRLAGGSEFRFPFVEGPLDARVHLRHRLLVEHLLRASRPDRLLVEETLVRLLREIVADSVRAHRASVPPRRPATESQHRELVEDAKAVLSRRFAEPLGLHDIAAVVHASPFHLARVFRAGTGSSLHAYRNQLRLRASLESLTDPHRQVAGVALELGYASASHFIDSFRSAFAMSPSRF